MPDVSLRVASRGGRERDLVQIVPRPSASAVIRARVEQRPRALATAAVAVASCHFCLWFLRGRAWTGVGRSTRRRLAYLLKHDAGDEARIGLRSEEHVG